MKFWEYLIFVSAIAVALIIAWPDLHTIWVRDLAPMFSR